ncbi:hypothetical protein BCR41DRAFT_3172 [Lobosporangium transversale]|uniref:Inositol polyphosphate-related phosphatase domain-containing protein n=1 Tax=Lobosporangium transversale TaxID=64571 RepID=A0A1Y2H3Z6_9FUNG|nr:hypothetical protein BCR41DRAFT_3172 [Lobosporangium transversale]ORZ28711.1 hypothetical protein BCR41DRAFT_3172 [Lobosporangium transversale]|eukprot:XP_021886384.1 hypothetical protein BCR41DRAFT_3172 [Lobosporangium transversale]
MDAWVSPLVKWFNGEGASVAVVQEPTEDAELPATDIGANQSTEQKERAQTIRNPSPIDHLLQQSTALKHGLSQDTHEQHYTHPTKKMLSIKDVLADPSSEGLQSQRTFVDSDPSLLMKFSNEDFIPTSAPVPTSTSVASTLPIPTAVALDEDVIGSILNTQQPQQILRDNPALTADQIASTPTPDSQPTRPKISIRSIVHALEWMIHNNNNRKRNKNEEETVIDDNHSYDTKTSSQQETSKRRKQRKQPSHPASPPPPPRPMISRTRLKVFVGTWNMMGQIPHISEGLTGFLEVQDPVVQNQQQQNCPDEQHKPGNFPSSPLLSPLSTLSEPDSNPSSTGTTQFQETVERKQKQQKQQQKPQHFARGIPSSMSTPNLLLSQSSMMSDTNSTEAPRQEFKQRGLFNRFKYKNNHKSSSGSNNGTPRVNLKPSPSVSNLPSHFQYHQQQQQQQYHHYLKQGFSQQRTPSLNPLPQVPTILKDPFLEMNAKAPYHIIAINTQECEREIREAVLFPSKSVWEKYLQKSLGPDYVMIKTETMAALHLAVFIWKPIEDLVTAVDSSTVATGIGGIVGNKGAVAISVYLGSMSFLFVNAHLTAHQNNTQARNNDYKRIIQELQLNDAPKSSPGGWYFGGDMRLRRHYNSPPVATGPSLQKPAYYGNNSNNKNNNSNSNIKRNDNAGGGSNGEKKSTNQSSTHSDGSESKKSSNNKNEGDKDKDKDPRMPRKDGRESGDSNVTQNSSANVDITNQFDYTFWAGDLNYRVDMTRAEADECLQKGDLKLMAYHFDNILDITCA